jgi:hypothetical protein
MKTYVVRNLSLETLITGFPYIEDLAFSCFKSQTTKPAWAHPTVHEYVIQKWLGVDQVRIDNLEEFFEMLEQLAE